MVDLGSGALIDLERFGLPHEPTVARNPGAKAPTSSRSAATSCSVRCQAGLIVGRRDLIERLNRNPLKRALRCDKITLAILHYTLRLYQNPGAPLRGTAVARDVDASARASDVGRATRCDGDRRTAPRRTIRSTTVSSECQIGSGALPEETLPSVAVSITAPSDRDVMALAGRLRQLDTPVIGRVQNGALWLDVRAIDDVDALCTTLEGL